MSVLRWPTKISEGLLLEISQADPGKFELTADGTLLMTPPTGSSGSLGEASLHEQVKAWAAVHDPAGFVLPASGGITLPDDGIWSPDTTYISAPTYDRASDEDLARAFWRLVPDAVFELMSETDAVGSEKYNLEIKAFRENALPLIVVLDPKERRTLTGRDGQPFEESFDLTLDLGWHMPRFVSTSTPSSKQQRNGHENHVPEAARAPRHRDEVAVSFSNRVDAIYRTLFGYGVRPHKNSSIRLEGLALFAIS